MAIKTGMWIGLPWLALSSCALAGASVGESLLDLSLEELLTIEVSSASLNGATLANTASWVAVIDENSWRKTGARRTFDALASQPATLVIPQVAGGEMVIIRGYARTTSHRGVALLWDDVPLTDFARGGPSTHIPDINLFTLSSIEYTQGPGSALHGSDAFHGVIGLKSFGPLSGRSAATLLTGSDGYYDAGVRNRIEMENGYTAGLALAANGQASQHQNYELADPLSGDRLSFERPRRYDTGTATLFLASDPDQDTSYQVSYYHHSYDAYGFVGLGPRYAPARDEAGETSDLQMGRVSMMHRFGPNRSLELRGYYWDLGNELDLNLALAGGTVLANQTQSYDQNRYGAQAIYRDDISALNTRWALALGHDVMGVYDSYNRLQTQAGVVLQQGPDALAGAQRQIDSATFEADTDLADGDWHLVWGARLDDYSDFGRQVSPRAGVIYHPIPSDSIKLLYSEAFRAPTATELNNSTGVIKGNPDLNPETTRNTELIWLRQTGDFTTQLSLFEGRWSEGIVTVTDPGTGMTQYQNQERNHSVGVSASHLVQWDSIQFDVASAWVDSRNETLDVEYGAFPLFLLNLGIGYSAQTLRTDFYLLQRLMLDMDAEVEGGRNPTGDRLPGYWRTDFTATWHAERQLDVMLVIRNLFDRGNRFPSITGNGGVEDERFSISVGARYRFDE